MKKKYFLFSVILAFSVLVVFYSVLGNSPSTANASTYKAETKLDEAELANFQITLSKPDKKAEITEEVAIHSATQSFPEWKTDEKEINVEYQIMTNTSFKLFSEKALEKNEYLKEKGYMDKLPVYIVSFEGLNIPSFSGIIHTEYNVVVDATSGESLMGFSYR